MAKLTASDAAASDKFGYSVAIDGNTVVVGAYLNDDEATTRARPTSTARATTGTRA